MLRSVLLMAVLIAGSTVWCRDLDPLRAEIQGKKPDEVRALIIRRFGPPAREVGSGFQIEEWDVNGGVLVYHPAVGPSFNKGGDLVWLMHTNNPAGLCLYGQYEMAAKPELPSGLGDLYVTWDSSYTFLGSRESSEYRKAHADDFFTLHPTGRVEVRYAPGVTAETRLEDLPDGSLVATLTFVPASGGPSKDYRIIASRTWRKLRLTGEAQPFEAEKGWVNYWR
jgi:hypothetical protein